MENRNKVRLKKSCSDVSRTKINNTKQKYNTEKSTYRIDILSMLSILYWTDQRRK